MIAVGMALAIASAAAGPKDVVWNCHFSDGQAASGGFDILFPADRSGVQTRGIDQALDFPTLWGQPRFEREAAVEFADGRASQPTSLNITGVEWKGRKFNLLALLWRNFQKVDGEYVHVSSGVGGSFSAGDDEPIKFACDPNESPSK